MDNQNDNRRSGNPAAMTAVRVLAIGYALYMLYRLVERYFTAGADAPSLTLVIVGAVLLGGGAAALGVLTWKLWKRDRDRKDRDGEN